MTGRWSAIVILVLAWTAGLASQRPAQDIGHEAGLQAEQRLAKGERVLILDPTATHVTFLVNTTLESVTGRFGMQSGTVRWDVKTGKASGLIVIDPVSGGTGTGWEDDILQNDVLKSAQYTRITFQPTKVTGVLIREGSTEFHVDGILRLLKVNHPLHIDFTVEAAGSQLWVAGHVVLPYADWGLERPGFWFLHAARTVSLDIATTGVIQDQPQPQPLL